MYATMAPRTARIYNYCISGYIVAVSVPMIFTVYIIVTNQHLDKMKHTKAIVVQYKHGPHNLQDNFLQHRKLNSRTRVKAPLGHQIVTYNLSKEVPLDVETFECVRTETNPKFKLCIHDPAKDKFISNYIKNGGIWEPHLTKIFTKALDNYPNAVTIDIGANIGYYSMLSCVKDHSVIAIEPAYTHIVRFHQGALYNNCHNKIVLLKNALYDDYVNVTLTHSEDNQGGIWIDQPNVIPGGTMTKLHHSNKFVAKQDEMVQTTTLDDLLSIAALSQAIIKIDIEGYECRVFIKGENFLKMVQVPYIFMEWQKMYSNKDKANSPCTRQQMWQITLTLTQLSYTPFEVHTGFQLNPEHSTDSWRIGDVYWKHFTAPDLLPRY